MRYTNNPTGTKDRALHWSAFEVSQAVVRLGLEVRFEGLEEVSSDPDRSRKPLVTNGIQEC